MYGLVWHGWICKNQVVKACEYTYIQEGNTYAHTYILIQISGEACNPYQNLMPMDREWGRSPSSYHIYNSWKWIMQKSRPISNEYTFYRMKPSRTQAHMHTYIYEYIIEEGLKQKKGHRCIYESRWGQSKNKIHRCIYELKDEAKT